eukprot:CAMPEP_0197186606 /NCGR_PEP_ID=MMETSP1423-20130617/14242_1 /TAXON_ID=476441 /ORGANISM="Pseudo-nitzschia heimii, Strain UNC1101" /LENGTH=279 /DNA_ID=CAMNT_0042637967 /DNA_START=12 /DNA_END=851 /DNA_ORIENTATION=+
MRKNSFLACILLILATQTLTSTGFLLAPSSVARQHIKCHRGINRTKQKQRKNLHANRESSPSAIRDGGQQSEDYGGTVAAMFGNLRIPASLLSGASLGSAFALPFLPSDSGMIGFAKRMYIFSMMTTLGSMLLVLIISTILINDIYVHPPRLANSVGDYIDENYALEWMMVRSHFYYGALAFIVGSTFRAYVSISCPVFGNAIVGILSSLSLISISYLIDRIRIQSGQRFRQTLRRYLKEIGDNMKAKPVFGIGVLIWLASVSYLIVKVPHIYCYFVNK